MERNIAITLEKAREWYKSDNKVLKEIALQAFDEKELNFDFRDIKTFQDACEALNLDFDVMLDDVRIISAVSKASAAMFKLNIIRKALNLGQKLFLTKNSTDSDIYYPYNPFITENSTYYKSELSYGAMEVIGKIMSKGTIYNVLGGEAVRCGYNGLSRFEYSSGVGSAYINVGLLGCASAEIAHHLGTCFGMLITEAKYGDLSDFKIIKNY